MRFLFILSTFVGSFALFLLEPMVAKELLPSFGGSSLVWNGCLLFFQAALLAGYGYANLLTNRAKVRTATPIHWLAIALALLLAATLLVPSKLWQIHPSPEANPLLPLLLTLGLTTAVPFIVLAAGTPLIQRWFAHSDDPHAHDPYFLYAASNLGSFCGLIAYPVLIEPQLTLAAQRLFVFGLIIAYAIVLVIASALVRKHVDAQSESHAELPPSEPITGKMRARWAALSAAPSALLLAVTSDLTKNIAPIPLLWVLPLGLYLLTFVIVFSAKARKLEAAGGAPFWLKIGLGLALAGGVYVTLETSPKIEWGLALAVAAFFFTALACHLQLARLRPSAASLTEYYLWVSIGGVLGGLFCAILAPLIFTGLTELPLAFGACVILYGYVQPGKRFNAFDVFVPLTALVFLFFIALWFGLYRVNQNGTISAEVTSLLVGAIFLATTMDPRKFASVYLCYLVVFAFCDKHQGSKTLFAGRNFYGYEAVTLEADGSFKRLINGNILHGVQFTDPVLSRQPTTYYAKDGPLGQALLPTLDSHPGAHIAAVGLGSGTEAAYGRPGMTIDFYELNPAIARIARDPKLFTYLRDSAAKINIILGDARLSLVAAPNSTYDVIILDAFSSDSIPIHLITSQAMALYKLKLKPDGLLLVHTSNRYLTLSNVVAASGATVGLTCDSANDNPQESSYRRTATSWLALANNRLRLQPIEGPKTFWEEFHAKAGTKPWTDDYSNVFRALREFN